MRVQIEKNKIIEVSRIFIECGENPDDGKKFYYLEMQPEYSVHEHLLFKYRDFRKNAYIDEYELIMNSLLEKGYADIEAMGMEEIHIDE